MRSETYWIEASRREDLDLDQIASQNYSLPLPVHQQIRLRQVSYLEALFQRLKDRPRVLDLGCGPGVWAQLLAPQVESWMGFDISPHFIASAQQEARKRQFTHLDFRVGSLFEVEPGKTFNLVVMGGILGYLQEPQLQLLLKRVYAWLEPDGLVYVRVSISPGIYPAISFNRKYPMHYRKHKFYLDRFTQAGFEATSERDWAFSEAALATLYTAAARWLGRTGMTAYRNARKLSPISFGWARKLLDLTPLPQSMQFVLRKSF